MELKDFIEQSVSDIIEATSNLKEKYNKNCDNYNDYGAVPIAPICSSLGIETKNHFIDFDVAVTTSEKGIANAEAKIGICVLGSNIKGEAGYNNENSSRIKFSIPFYPEFINKSK